MLVLIRKEYITCIDLIIIQLLQLCQDVLRKRRIHHNIPLEIGGSSLYTDFALTTHTMQGTISSTMNRTVDAVLEEAFRTKREMDIQILEDDLARREPWAYDLYVNGIRRIPVKYEDGQIIREVLDVRNS